MYLKTQWKRFANKIIFLMSCVNSLRMTTVPVSLSIQIMLGLIFSDSVSLNFINTDVASAGHQMQPSSANAVDCC